jgi:xylan 1,4-beta-xylosidase
MTLGSLARYDELGNQAVYPGEYTVMIDLEPDWTMTWNFTVVRHVGVLEEWPQSPPVQQKRGVMEMFWR